ncbi:MAG: hypothetical protein ACLFS7_07515 [Desulfosudaceae bacterium]
MNGIFGLNEIRGRVVMALVIVLAGLGLVFLPACSNDNGEEMAPSAGKAASGDKDPTAMEQGQEQAPGAEQEEADGERQEDIERMNQLQQELTALQQKVIENNPDLEEDQQALQELVTDKLEQKLAENDIDMERIQELQAQLQSSDLEEEEKSELMDEFRSKAQIYNQARADAMNDEEVQENYQKYVDELKTLMEEEDPNMPEKTKEIEELQLKLQQSQPQNQQAPQQ